MFVDRDAFRKKAIYFPRMHVSGFLA